MRMLKVSQFKNRFIYTYILTLPCSYFVCIETTTLLTNTTDNDTLLWCKSWTLDIFLIFNEFFMEFEESLLWDPINWISDNVNTIE